MKPHLVAVAAISNQIEGEKKKKEKFLPHAATNLVHRESCSIEDRKGVDFILR